MVFPIAGGTQDTGYEISNSLRFNDDDSPYAQRTPSSAGNRKTWTLSMWFKRCDGSDRMVLGATPGSDNNSTLQLILHQNGDFRFGLNSFNVFSSNELFRDVSAWYHMVFSVDSTDGTASDRVKWYVNGTRITSFAADGFSSLSQNHDFGWNNTIAHTIGAESASSDHMNGYIAEVHNIDGQALDASYFGEFNDNGVWIPKQYTGSYGTNGFFLEFQQTGTSQNSSGIGADTSGNDNHLAVNSLSATDVTEDTPTNNFATWNPLDPNRADDLSEGNTQYVSPTSAREQIRSTFGLTSGKWYWETKPTTANGGLSVGVLKENASMTLDDSLGKDAYGWSYDSGGSSRHSNSSTSSGFDTYTSNDIIGVALDLDNHEIFFYKNGTAQNSGNKAFDLDTGETYFAACGSNSSGSTETFQVNFGNPSFSISSGNTDGKYGNFEYAPPSGYYALCTKRLAEFG
jgi:hypothetical protein